MNNLKSKLKKQGGFTLIEMLIVVAIIAILIAIAIPLVNSALEKAREATDAANERAAIGLASIAYMSNEKGGTEATKTGIDSSAGGTAYYLVEKGTTSSNSSTGGQLLAKKATGTSAPTYIAYGRGTLAGDIASDNASKVIKITVTPGTADADPKYKIEWVDLASVT